MKIFIAILFFFFALTAHAQKANSDTLKQTADTSTRQASFPGGDIAWRSFVTKMLQRNMDDFIRDGKSGVCRIRFIVNEDGTVGDIRALTMQDSELAKRSMKAIAKGPKWIPAMLHGRYVKAYREEPITITISNQ